MWCWGACLLNVGVRKAHWCPGNESNGATYFTPSQDIVDIVDVPSVPLLSLSPDRKLVSYTQPHVQHWWGEMLASS